MQSNRQLCEETVARITELVPPAELRYAFIAGSRAVGDPRSDSDVDYVVVLNRPSRSHEVAVAQAMRDIHRAHALQYSHCGEILSRPTLENMLSASPQLRNLVEIGFLECACFGADCILSIARKFLVVLHMLSGPKCDIVGDTDALADDAARAGQFFASVPGFHFPKSPQVLDWSGAPADSPRSARWRQVMDQVQAGNHLDTPVGVGLERWFMQSLNPLGRRTSDDSPRAELSAITPGRCTLEGMSAQDGLRGIIQVQCLSP